MRNRVLSALLFLVMAISLAPAALAAPGEAMALSEEGVAFLAAFDEFTDTAYQSGDKWYIGYHTAIQAGDYPDGITRAEALELLEEAAQTAVTQVNDLMTSRNLTLSQEGFDALVSFTLSLGTAWTGSSYRFASYLYGGLDARDPVEVADAMGVWSHVDGQADEDCLYRRLREAELLLYGDYHGEDRFAALILEENGGALSGNDTVCYAAGEAYGSLPQATRSGYALDGWQTEEGSVISTATTAREIQRVEAVWRATSRLSFTDVATGDWFYPYVYDLYNAGIINGYTAQTFAPQLPITAGQALKLVVLAAGYDAQAAANGHWAGGYLTFAVKEGFTTDGGMDLDEPMSRLDIARLAAAALEATATTTQSPFADTSDPAVIALYEAGVLEGSLDGGTLRYKPNDSITRAEITTMIWRMEGLDKPSHSDPGTQTPVTPAPPVNTHEGQFEYNGRWLDILPGVPKNAYDASKFYTRNGFTLYNSADYTNKIGVDVSSYQGEIDWPTVKAQGVDFAIIRAAGRGYGSSGNLYTDAYFTRNIEGALAAGLEVGVYFFSQAITEAEAVEEARVTLDLIRGYDVTYPIVFDWETVSAASARTNNITTSMLGKCAQAFCKTVAQAGYTPMVYFNTYCGYFKYDMRDIAQYDLWFAGYTATPRFYYNFQMWQYSSKGSVSGIKGNVDLNLQLIPR